MSGAEQQIRARVYCPPGQSWLVREVTDVGEEDGQRVVDPAAVPS